MTRRECQGGGDNFFAAGQNDARRDVHERNTAPPQGERACQENHDPCSCIVQVGMSVQSHDASQRSQGFLCLLGGLLIAFAKQILSAIGVV